MKLKYETYLKVSETGHFISIELKDISTIYKEGSRIRGRESTQYLKQRGLSGARSSHNGNHFGLICKEIHTFQYFQRPERLFYSFCLYHIHHSFPAKIQTISNHDGLSIEKTTTLAVSSEHA